MCDYVGILTTLVENFALVPLEGGHKKCTLQEVSGQEGGVVNTVLRAYHNHIKNTTKLQKNHHWELHEI